MLNSLPMQPLLIHARVRSTPPMNQIIQANLTIDRLHSILISRHNTCATEENVHLLESKPLRLGYEKPLAKSLRQYRSYPLQVMVRDKVMM